ncbi:MAG: ABC transporter permease subunit, partial [Thermoanaerobaculia bacterium]|nr:ABC transporter permease subunit [Thermoanaerobaculia bacterium]
LLLRDWVYRLLAPFEPLAGDTLVTASILLAVMILPTLTTLADDALRGVPAAQRQAGRALGLTRSETLFRLVLPQARSGLMAALLIALGRASGETIAIYLVIGRLDGNLASPFAPLVQPGQTLTTKLGGPELFLAAGDPVHWSALMGLGALLLMATTATTLVGRSLAKRGAANA